MKSNLDWYKKPENRDKVKQIVETLDELGESKRYYHFGALDYDGSYFIYNNEPYLAGLGDKDKVWMVQNGEYFDIVKFEGYYDNWRETLISLDDLRVLVEAEVSPSLKWYKKPENLDKAKQIIKALDELDKSKCYRFGAFDYNGKYFVYDSEPYLSDFSEKYREWLAYGEAFRSIITFEGYYDDWKETLVSLTELKEFVAQMNSTSNEQSESANSPELSVHLRKKLVLEIKEFSDGQCKYLVKESFGIPDNDTSGYPIGADAVDYIWSADSKEEFIDTVQQIFTGQRSEPIIEDDIYTWEEK